MIPAALALLVVAPGTLSEQIDVTSRAISNWKVGSATIDAKLVEKGKTYGGTYELTHQAPDRLVLRSKEPSQSGLDAIDRTFALDGRKVIGYDWTTNEAIKREAPTTVSLYQRYVSVIGNPNDAVRFLLDDKFPHEFMHSMSLLPGWKKSSASDSLTWTLVTKRSGKPNTTTSLSFFSNGLPRRISISDTQSSLLWTYAYRPSRTATFTPPKSATFITSFMQRLAPPKFMDEGAKSAVVASQRAYDRLSSVNCETSDDRGAVTIKMSGGRFGEGRPSFSWAYDGKTLTVVDAQQKRAWKGPSSRISVLDKVVAVGGSVHSMTRFFLLRENPMRQLLTPDFKVRSAGEISMNGASCRALQLTGDRWSGSMLVRKSDGLLAGLTVRTKDARGSTLTQSNQTFAYKAIGTPISASQFMLAIPAGYKTTGFPKR